MKKKALTIFAIVFSALVLAIPVMKAEAKSGEEDTLCLGCHGEKDMSLSFKNGENISLFVDSRHLAGSAHKDIGCAGCHEGFSAADHPQRNFKSKRSLTVAASSACLRCHEVKTGSHARMLSELRELVCVDCHGFHTVKTVNDKTSSDRTDGCMGCHKYRLKKSFKDGTTHSLMVDAEAMKGSVHSKMRCVDCHFGFSAKEHPERRFNTKRDLSIVSSEMCRRCHFDKYSKTLESIHFSVLSRGNLRAPVCVDCHGAHEISSGKKEKFLSVQRCQRCHGEVYRIYSRSVHGKSLFSEKNQDVPACADCHKAHDINDAHLTDFRNNIPQMCGKCHANAELMRKYGLSTSVLQSYLEDFHGVTLTFYKKQEKAVRHIAVCTDCHGMHDIMRTKGPDSAMMRTNLLQRCQKCHKDATKNFPDSWISHYEPSMKRAPLVYAVTITYKFFIPFMIVGLVVQIALHIWRYAVNR